MALNLFVHVRGRRSAPSLPGIRDHGVKPIRSFLRLIQLERRLLALQPAEHPNPEHEKKQVWKPDEKLRMELRVRTQGVGDNDEEKVENGNDQADRETKGGLAPMGGDP